MVSVTPRIQLGMCPFSWNMKAGYARPQMRDHNNIQLSDHLATDVSAILKISATRF